MENWPDSFANGQMQLYDVGMASMHTMDSFALAELCEAVGRTADAEVMRQRGLDMSTKITDNLWDDEEHAFINLLPNGSFYRRISPTSFYALQTGMSICMIR